MVIFFYHFKTRKPNQMIKINPLWSVNGKSVIGRRVMGWFTIKNYEYSLIPWFGPGVVTCPAVVPSSHPSSRGQMVSDASGSRINDRPLMVPSALCSDNATQTYKI